MRGIAIVMVAFSMVNTMGCATNEHTMPITEEVPKVAYKVLGHDICFFTSESYEKHFYTRISKRLPCGQNNVELRVLNHSVNDERILVDGTVLIESDKGGGGNLFVKKEGLFFDPKSKNTLRWFYSEIKPAMMSGL